MSSPTSVRTKTSTPSRITPNTRMLIAEHIRVMNDIHYSHVARQFAWRKLCELTASDERD